MKQILIKRLLQTIPTLVGITLISFFLMQLAPGGPIDQITDLNPRVTPEVKQRIAKDLGLDQPILKQYGVWVSKLVRFDFGKSFQDQRPVIDKILERLPATLLLNVLSMGVLIFIAIPLGMLAATRAGTLWDKCITIFVFIGFATPTYALALGLMVIFGLHLGWLPISGLRSLHLDSISWIAQGWDLIRHLILPTFVLAFTSLAGLSRYMRSGLLEVLHQDYIRAAWAKGLTQRQILWKHALRNALIPFVTLFGLMLPDLIGGSVIIESIFAFPGMGRLAYEAILTRDYNLIMAITVLAALLTLIGNFLADVLYALVDPRIRYR